MTLLDDLTDARYRLDLQMERVAVLEEAQRLALLAQLLEEVERPVPPPPDPQRTHLRDVLTLIASAMEDDDE